MQLITSHVIDFKILCGLSHEPKTITAIKRLLKPGMTAIDVGANIGWITLHLASLVGSTGKVCSFEPSDWTYERLSHNIRMNAFSWINAERKAVGSSDVSSIDLTLPCGYRLDGKDTATQQYVPLVKLDTELAHLNRIDFIKSDTDGYEPGVFDGARLILRKHRPLLLFEVAPDHTRRAGHNLERLFTDLSSLGYQFESLSGATIDPNIEMTSLPPNASIDIIARA